MADAAYVASRAATHELCTHVRTSHRWDAVGPPSPLTAALHDCRDLLPDPAVLDAGPSAVKQGSLVRAVEMRRVQQWRAAGSPDDNCRLNAHSAHAAGREFSLTPSKTLDTNFTTFEFSTAVTTRLGVDVTEGGEPCPLCGQLLDACGRHALTRLPSMVDTALPTSLFCRLWPCHSSFQTEAWPSGQSESLWLRILGRHFEVELRLTNMTPGSEPGFRL